MKKEIRTAECLYCHQGALSRIRRKEEKSYEENKRNEPDHDPDGEPDRPSDNPRLDVGDVSELAESVARHFK